VLRGLIALGGAVATGAGIHTALAGSRAVPGFSRAARVDPVLDSEIRFFGAIYAAFGIGALGVAAQSEPAPGAVRGIAAAVFGAGLARIVGWRRVGRPDPRQLALLAVELSAPPALVAVQAAQAPGSPSGSIPSRPT
jgi:hypothetical protein